MPKYKIVYQQPFVYIDNGFPVNGFLIRARIEPWNEIAEINVPRLDADLIDSMFKEIVDNRMKLDLLGNMGEG